MKKYKLIIGFGKKYLFQFVLLFFCIIATTIIATFYPWFFGDIVDEIVQRRQEQFSKLVLIWIVIYFLNQSLHFALNMTWTSLMTGFLVDIRKKVYEVILRYTGKKLSKANVGEFVEVMNESVNEVLNFIHWNLFYLIGAIVNLLIAFYLLFSINKIIFYIIVLVVPMMFWISKIKLPIIQKYSDEIVNQKNSLSVLSFDAIKNVQEIKLLNAIDNVIEKIEKEMKDLFSIQVKNENLKLEYVLINATVNFVVRMLIYLYSAFLIKNHILSVGKFVAIIGYLEICLHAFDNIAERFSDIPNNISNIKKILDLLNGEQEQEIEKSIKIQEGKIEFRNVKFGFENNIVLNGISFTVQKGKKNAIVGLNGMGKTTIIGLINRIYDSEQGEILVDGYKITECNISSLRNQIGVVYQENIIFEGSLRYNIDFLNDSNNDEKIIGILEKLNLCKLLERLEDGLNTYMTPENIKLSGGERQRISIARILFRNPMIYLFDEITSALDEESEMAIKAVIDEIAEKKTVIMITHKPSIMEFCDRIIMLQDGKIVGDANYGDMKNQCTFFSNMIHQ